MASFATDHLKKLMLDKSIDFANDTFKAILLMTNTTADTEKDKATISAYTTLDEMDGAGYSVKTLTTPSTHEDNSNHLGYWDADDFTWTGVSAGTRSVQGMLIYKFVSNQASSIPLLFVDTGGFPFAANGGDIAVTVNASGLMQVT